jgi:hypothetical protein
MDLIGMGHRLFKGCAKGPVVETLFSLFLEHTPLCLDTYGAYFQVQHPFRFEPDHKFELVRWKSDCACIRPSWT